MTRKDKIEKWPLADDVVRRLPNPCYVMDMDLLDRNLEKLRRTADEVGVEIILALKGFAMWSAFGRLHDHGFDQSTASSLWEARLAVEEMGKPAYTYAVSYTPEEIEEMASLSSHLTFNSLAQFGRFSSVARAVNGSISLGLRVNPEISSVGVDLYNPCVPGSRLGVRLGDLPAARDLPSGMEGFHCHALCESDAAGSCRLIDRFEERFADYLPHLKWVNFGGGHLITRQGHDTALLVERLQAFKARWPHLHVILEPGAAFVWQTGYLLARVEDVVRNGGLPVAVMNVSFTAHMPDCLEQPYYPAIYGACHVEPGKETEAGVQGHRYRLGGNSCLAGDFMGDWVFPEPLHAGSLLLFKDMIHYTFVKTTMFNGVHHPSLCMLRGGEIAYRRDFGYQDFKSRLS